MREAVARVTALRAWQPMRRFRRDRPASKSRR
jgi:hypothetical protein